MHNDGNCFIFTLFRRWSLEAERAREPERLFFPSPCWNSGLSRARRSLSHLVLPHGSFIAGLYLRVYVLYVPHPFAPIPPGPKLTPFRRRDLQQSTNPKTWQIY